MEYLRFPDSDSEKEDKPIDTLRVPRIVGANAYSRYAQLAAYGGKGYGEQAHILFDREDNKVVPAGVSLSQLEYVSSQDTGVELEGSILDFSTLKTGRHKKLSEIISDRSYSINIFRDTENKIKAIVAVGEDKNLVIIGVVDGKGFAVKKEIPEDLGDQINIYAGEIIDPLKAIMFVNISRDNCQGSDRAEVSELWNNDIKSGVVKSWEEKFGTGWRSELGDDWERKVTFRKNKKLVH